MSTEPLVERWLAVYWHPRTGTYHATVYQQQHPHYHICESIDIRGDKLDLAVTMLCHSWDVPAERVERFGSHLDPLAGEVAR